jgi:adenylate cyclase
VTEAPRSSTADLEQFLLGGRRRYTREQIAATAGVPLSQARRFWRALGFPNVEDGAQVFTDADLDSLRRLTALIDGGVIDDALAVRVTRSMGQALARLADAQVEMLLSPGVTGGTGPGPALAEAERLLPELERLLVYAWRRQLAAAAGRLLAGQDETTSGRLAVGFADLVGFTRLSHRLEEAELAHLVETFESRTADVVAALGGRVVKTLGDEVLFVADGAAAAAEIALELIEAMAGHDHVPELRVGCAVGNVLSRMGDIFGTTVNLASRLTTLAQPDTVVVDGEMAAALGDDAAYQVRPMRRRPVRGLGTVEPWLLSRAPVTAGPG